MNYKIYVDHSRFSNSAKKVEEYIGTIDSYMASMNSDVEDMMSIWDSDDSVSFKEKWSQNESMGSAISNLKDYLKQYADDLNEAANIYRNAQISAINEANSLPNW